ncbi:DUF6266 family protein [Pedobacter nyackensis]|uniref:Uncharacterized protein n=1 Tax=Pedobacter nyackensis TaxID=475255 RepID=A0A1W2C0F0_9SPHI|nr:DUF6266 family protein [Pedobacter nyackensis]SMC78727.1 hypothetical protein SAMN04488101_10329 [Pedobacter nyackensis]
MAIIRNGILGPVSGKLGSVVFVQTKGGNFVRQAPKKKPKGSPRSPAQTANQQKMKFFNEFLTPFYPFFTVGFQNLPPGKTALSIGYSVNYHRVFTGEYPKLGVDCSKVVISEGTLPQLNEPEMKLIADDILELTWQQNTNPKASFDDQVMLVVYSPELKIADGFTGGAKRTSRQCLFRFDRRLVGKQLEVYVGVTSMNRKKVADSVYLGRIEG